LSNQRKRRPSKRERQKRLRWFTLGLVVLIAIAWIWLGAGIRELAGEILGWVLLIAAAAWLMRPSVRGTIPELRPAAGP
jgi:fatty acid desaturase